MAEPKVVTSLVAVAAPAELAPLLHATGIPGEMDFMDYLALQGYVFTSASSNLGNFDLGEVGADNMDIDPTEPSFMFDVPEGLTVIPLYAGVAFEVATRADTILAIAACENVTYASGGAAALTVRNSRTDDPRAYDIKNQKADGESGNEITANAAVNLRTLWMWGSPTDQTAGDPFIVEYKPAVHAYIVGPGSFFFYCHSLSTAASYRATFGWAEVPSAIITKP